MGTYYLNFTNYQDECGSILISLLAYPKDDKNDTDRSNLQASLCHLLYRSKAELDPDWAITLQLIKPIYALRDQKAIGRDLRQLKRRLNDRMVAAKMALAFLQEVQLGDAFVLPKGLKQLSMNQLSEFVLGDAGYISSENLETRIWRESLPVIHLATATATLINELEHAGVASPSIGYILTCPDLVKRIVEISHLHAEMLIKSTKLSIDKEQLVVLKIS
jgi:hypothetical protein